MIIHLNVHHSFASKQCIFYAMQTCMGVSQNIRLERGFQSSVTKVLRIAEADYVREALMDFDINSSSIIHVSLKIYETEVS